MLSYFFKIFFQLSLRYGCSLLHGLHESGAWNTLTVVTCMQKSEDEEKPYIPSVYNEEEDFDTELEEDLIIEEEW